MDATASPEDPSSATIQPANTALGGMLSAGRLLANSIAYYRAHGNDLLPVLLVPAVLSAAAGLWKGPALIGFLFFLASLVAGILSYLSLFGILAGGWDAHASGGIPGLYRKSCSLFFSWAWTNAYAVLAVIGGTLLFLIPGIYIAIMLVFVSYVYFAEEKRGKEALIASWWYVQGHWWGVFWRLVFFTALVMLVNILFGLIMMVESLSFGDTLTGPITAPSLAVSPAVQLAYIGVQSLIITPFGFIYPLLLYRMLQVLKQGTTMTAEEEKKIRKTITTLMRIGLAGLIILILASVFVILFLSGLSPLSVLR